MLDITQNMPKELPDWLQLDPREVYGPKVRDFRRQLGVCRRHAQACAYMLDDLTHASSAEEVDKTIAKCRALQEHISLLDGYATMITSLQFGPNSPHCKLMSKIAFEGVHGRFLTRDSAALQGLGKVLDNCVDLKWIVEMGGNGKLVITIKGQKHLLAMNGEDAEEFIPMQKRKSIAG